MPSEQTPEQRRLTLAALGQDALIELVIALEDGIEDAKLAAKLADEDADGAARKADEAEQDRDTLLERQYDLDDERRYSLGMGLPEARALAKAWDILQGKHPHTMTRLIPED